MSKSVNNEAVKFLVNLRKIAVKNRIRATTAVELLMDEMPDLSRAETYNSAEIAGINIHTARGVYDRRTRSVH